MATFSDGDADLETSLTLSMFLHGLVHGGLEELSDFIVPPGHEPPREYVDFEFIAFWNCFAAIANAIAMSGHGGTVLIVSSSENARGPLLRRKYAMEDTTLSKAFVDFINARHKVRDLYYLRDIGEIVNDEAMAQLDWKLKLVD